MPSIKLNFSVEMEDGTTFDVTGDQRDIAKYEAQEFYDESGARRMTMVRFVAWSAAKRQGKTDLDWIAFDAKCVEAADAPGEPRPLAPGPQGQPADS